MYKWLLPLRHHLRYHMPIWLCGRFRTVRGVLEPVRDLLRLRFNLPDLCRKFEQVEYTVDDYLGGVLQEWALPETLSIYS